MKLLVGGRELALCAKCPVGFRTHCQFPGDSMVWFSFYTRRFGSVRKSPFRASFRMFVVNACESGIRVLQGLCKNGKVSGSTPTGSIMLYIKIKNRVQTIYSVEGELFSETELYGM